MRHLSHWCGWPDGWELRNKLCQKLFSDHQKKYSGTAPLDIECIMRFNILSAGIHWTLNLPSAAQQGELGEMDEETRTE